MEGQDFTDPERDETIDLNKIPADRSLLLPYLAISNGHVGDADGVHRLLADSRKLADADDAPYGRVLPYAAGAVAEALVGHIEHSDALLREAETRLREVELEYLEHSGKRVTRST